MESALSGGSSQRWEKKGQRVAWDSSSSRQATSPHRCRPNLNHKKIKRWFGAVLRATGGGGCGVGVGGGCWVVGGVGGVGWGGCLCCVCFFFVGKKARSCSYNAGRVIAGNSAGAKGLGEKAFLPVRHQEKICDLSLICQYVAEKGRRDCTGLPG